MNAQTETLEDLFGPVIYSYSRAQGFEDGVLVNLSEVAGDVCRQHYKFPVACTAEVWGVIDRAVKNPRYGNDVRGIVHDMLWMSRKAGRVVDASTRIFPVIIMGASRSKNFSFKIICGPGDNAEPVMTIMMPNED